MTERAMIHDLVPFAHVADIERSIAFYSRLGFTVKHALRWGERLGWAFLQCDRAQLMLSRADGPIERDRQSVLFYLYTRDLPALRAQLLADGASPGDIVYPEHMRGGEMRIDDPDGYCLLIGQMEGYP